MSKLPLVVYHGPTCLDGLGAAAAAYATFGENAEYVMGIYQADQAIDVEARDVILVDFCYTPDVICDILKKCATLTILDHHKAAVEAIAHIRHPRLHNFSDVKYSGAILAWRFFHKTPPPLLLVYIQDRDLWKFIYPETRAITTALYSRELSFKTLLSQDTTELLTEGTLLLRVHDKECQDLIKYGKRWMLFSTPHEEEAFQLPVVNAPPKYASDIGNLLAKEHGMGVTYCDNQYGRIFSIRGDGTQDVSKIARMFGGNGHPAAAGFKVPRTHYLATV